MEQAARNNVYQPTADAVLAYEEEYQALLQPVQVLEGVSVKRAGLLKKLDVYTVFDLLMLIPRRYEDWTSLKQIQELLNGEEEVFRATVSRAPNLRRQGKRSTLRTVLRDESAAIQAVWFNQPYLLDKLSKGTTAVFRGKVKRGGQTFEIINPTLEAVGSEEDVDAIRYLHPVYPLTAGLTQGVLRQIVAIALERFASRVPEAIPAEIRREHRLCEIAYAVRQIHQPTDDMARSIARRRLAFEELFMTLIGLRLIRRHQDDEKAVRLSVDEKEERQIQAVEASLPFELTVAQQRVLGEVFSDMRKDRPMSRLVQGDVGSGKTVVAALAMLYTALAGYQSVMMAPTSILAAQHHKTLTRILKGSSYNVALLTGQTAAAERKKLLDEVEGGRIHLLVGTHALLEDRVSFHNLALAITDEQHRFGVRQRIRLTKENDKLPHVMVMSATPIPRTLALILYGDLSISLIDEMPAGRKDILTYTAKTTEHQRVLSLMEKHLLAGEQAYVVCPLVKDSELVSELRSAEDVYQEISASHLLRHGIGLLHGQMKNKEKQETIDRFMSGEVKVLVSTTVIEVGVDNPNATFMYILNAERFGLAELHQLRGRIGRGDRQSLCVLSSDVQEGIGRERLRALCHTQSGFEIAERDLELRGPGDFFGTRQHGIPLFRIANLYNEAELLQETSEVVTRLLADDPKLVSTENRRIRPALIRAFGLPMAQLGI